MGNTAEETESMEQNAQANASHTVIFLAVSPWTNRDARLPPVVVIHEIRSGKKRDRDSNQVRYFVLAIPGDEKVVSLASLIHS
jgi:hypothetical protein